jgi:hypothetical protein
MLLHSYHSHTEVHTKRRDPEDVVKPQRTKDDRRIAAIRNDALPSLSSITLVSFLSVSVSPW